MFKIRYKSFDEIIYNEIYVNNSYKIKPCINDYIVIDVGCHVGSFVKLAVENGAKFVDGYELYPESYQQCLSNTENYSNVNVSNKAVWRSDIETEFVQIANSKLYSLVNGQHILNTGGETLLPELSAKDLMNIPTISFDSIIMKNYDKFGIIDLVKMDCEGSEYPILYTSNKLDLVQNIVMEYHYYSYDFREDALVGDKSNYNENSMAEYLNDKGFIVYIDEHQYMSDDIYHGNMFAMRDDDNNPFLIDYLKNGGVYNGII